MESRGCSRTVSFVFEQSEAPCPERGLGLVTRRPELSAILNCDSYEILTVLGSHFKEPGGFALLQSWTK